MNFVRSSLSIRSILGQRSRQAVGTWSSRGMCSKNQDVKPEAQPLREESRPAFKVPGLKPSNLEKKILIWSGRFQTEDQIPELVSPNMIDASRNRVRIKVCLIMMGITIVACLVVGTLGKRAASRNESLMATNIEKKARLRESARQEKEAANALSDQT
ncbi:protein FAM162B isoform X1 [Cynoglossus semilaevis]|uniref:Family with sequence similarity 162 member A n=1 Tax=Cynoglossus semilaevis TaxID=244447 RepID=A0A3P8WI03_CYNSE|nr:protein FAM162B-like isoform X1 [Cynoglossus semilaevis]